MGVMPSPAMPWEDRHLLLWYIKKSQVFFILQTNALLHDPSPLDHVSTYYSKSKSFTSLKHFLLFSDMRNMGHIESHEPMCPGVTWVA